MTKNIDLENLLREKLSYGKHNLVVRGVYIGEKSNEVNWVYQENQSGDSPVTGELDE